MRTTIAVPQPRRARVRPARTRFGSVIGGAVGGLSLALLLAGCSSGGGGGVVTEGGAASCADVLRFDGHTFLGHGQPPRDPSPAGSIGSGTRLGCDDGAGAVPDTKVEVVGVRGVAAARAVLADDRLYVRKDLPLPAPLRRLMTAPACTTAGTFRVRGDWLDVQSTRRVRFDGDIRAPYRVSVHVTDGPDRYVATTISIRATAATRPALRPTDVTSSLWKGGGIVAHVRCSRGRFVAQGLTSIPG